MLEANGSDSDPLVAQQPDPKIKIGSPLSSADMRTSFLNIEAEQAKLETALVPLLVMLTDLVNSTVYYDRLGDIAAKTVIFTHNQLLFPLIENNRGVIVKTTGDGVLATFDNPDEGIKAAMEIQQILKTYNQGRDPESVISVRIGLHYGKTLVFENDVFGDSINTTARIEALAEGGQICVSQAVVNASKLGGELFFPLGHIHLKGKLEPVSISGLVWEKDDPELIAGYETKRSLLANQTLSAAKARISIDGKIALQDDETVHLIAQNNPFFYRTGISQPEFFFGREILLHKVFSRLSAPRPQSISLYGERRIGKSSLLCQIQSKKLRQKNLPEWDKVVFVSIDIQSMRSATIEHFIERLFTAVKDAFKGRIQFDLPSTYQGVTTLVSELTKAEIKLIILFDEFDLITLNPNFTEEFYSWLRSLASHYLVAYVTSSLTQLQNLCATKKISDSPFFNIFTAFQVNTFTPAETACMIQGLLSLSQSGHDFTPWLPEIHQQAGFLPFYLQIYCANLYDLYPGNPTPAEVAEAFWDEAREHFEHIIRNLSTEETDCIRCVINGKKIAINLDQYTQSLIRKGYLVSTAGELRVFSQVFVKHFLQSSGNAPTKSFWSKVWKR